MMLAYQYSGENIENCIFEIKYDGARIIAECSNGNVKLTGRENDKTKNYPEIVDELKKLNINATFDGEMCIFKNGKSEFSELQKREHIIDKRKINIMSMTKPATYMVFDIISLGNIDCRNKTLMERKEILKEIFSKINSERIKMVEYKESINELMSYAKENGLEGIMIKRKDSVYEDKRSNAWLKLKFIEEQDFEIYGYTNETREVSALILGKDGKFYSRVNFCFGNSLYKFWVEKLKNITTDEVPFETDIPKSTKIYWVKPIYTAKVRFMQQYENGKLRQPILIDINEKDIN